MRAKPTKQSNEFYQFIVECQIRQQKHIQQYEPQRNE